MNVERGLVHHHSHIEQSDGAFFSQGVKERHTALAIYGSTVPLTGYRLLAVGMMPDTSNRSMIVTSMYR